MKKPFLRSLLCIILMLVGLALSVSAQDDNKDGFPNPELVVIPGTIQSQLGCSGDWQPDCTNTALTFDEATSLWTGTFSLPAGSYEYKVALDGGWDRNYGANGEAGGANFVLVLDADTDVTFTYNHTTGILTDSVNGGGASAPLEQAEAEPAKEVPNMVSIPGNLNPAFGCSGEWQPDCAEAGLEYNEAWDVWLKTFTLPAGAYEYKVAINGAWDENYGGMADAGGANVVLTMPADGEITFYYDHKTNWVADSIRNTIVTAFGDFQNQLGCESASDPSCMASWLQDPDGDGIFTLSTTALSAGDYTAQFAIGRVAEGAGEPVTFNVPADGTNVSFTYDSGLNLMVVSAGGSTVSGADLRKLTAHWVSTDTILWDQEAQDGVSYQLIYSATGAINLSLFGLEGDFETLDLTPNPDGASETVLAKFPHLAGLNAFTLTDTTSVSDILRGQVAIAAFNGDNLVAIAGLQIPGVLDELYTTDAPLGVNFSDGIPSISVWAPTAKNVTLMLFDDSNPRTDPQDVVMTRDDASGVWSVTGDETWNGKYYLYRIEVFAPTVMEMVINEVTDPYSISLSQNSQRSGIIDLSDASLKPAGWDELAKPNFGNPEDITIYELHIRDFSAFDETVPVEMRGTYMAFTLPEASGVKHLTTLAQAGLTHLHLLPSFDLATINENRNRWFEPDYAAMADMPADGEEQQALVQPVRDLDGFNWGYDPYHFMVPEGSYSTNPDGTTRIIEYRQMVQAINGMGLNMVQDVVFNHTNSSGQNSRSVFDKVVPGYYHRLNNEGLVEKSTCCDNTATEHNMMRRLMIDTLVLNVIEYKVDGFRFDLMGHHMLADMVEVRAALDALTLEKDGVDGKRIYIYGEGWNFGEVADNARGVNATQLNIGGTGIGVFNDRLRDAVRGGSPFGDREEQGLSNGIFSNPNGLSAENESLDKVLLFADQVRVGLAGNLRDYTFVDRNGDTVTGADVDYNGAPVGYTLDPQENIIYIDKHDNESLYDNNIYKAPDGTSMADRVRMQTLGNSYILYAQGVPFFQAGTDLLRSKSMDRNSYNSGDWFNRLDFTMQTNNFGVGLPSSSDNSGEWERMKPFLANPANIPTPDDIMATTLRFQDMLKVRYSSPLFRLTTAEEIQNRLSFAGVSSDQAPGVIVMVLDDTVGEDIDPNYAKIVVIFNATNAEIAYDDADLAEMNWELHPVLAEGNDELLKTATFADTTFTVPAYSAAVFVVKQ